MIIKRLRIGRFGKLENIELEFKDRLNIIYGENEAGKSTVQNFIKAMLYGMNSQKKSIRENDRKRFLPWSGENARGELVFEADSESEYVIKRSFGSTKREDEAYIYNAITGVNNAFKDPFSVGSELFGLGEEAFEKTLFVKQLGAEVDRDKEDEIMKKLFNLSQSGDEKVSFYQAVKLLEEIKKKISSSRGNGRLDVLEEKYQILLEERKMAVVLQDSIVQDLRELEEATEKKRIIKSELEDIESSKKNINISGYKDIEMYLENFEDVSISEVLKQAKEKINEVARNLQQKRAKECELKGNLHYTEEVLKKFEVYENLDEDIERKVLKLDGERLLLQDKLKQQEALEKELKNLKEQYFLEIKSLGNLEKFENVSEEQEKMIYNYEEKIKELKHSLELNRNMEQPQQKGDSFSVSNDVYKKSFYLIIIFLLLAIPGILSKPIFFFLPFGITPIAAYILFRKKSGSSGKGIKKDFSESTIKYGAIEEEIRCIHQKLYKIYEELEVNDYQSFISRLRKYSECKGSLEAAKIRIEEKNAQLLSLDEREILEGLDRNRKFTDFLFKHCGVSTVDDFIDNLHKFKLHRNQQVMMEKELSVLVEAITSEEEKIKEIRENFLKEYEKEKLETELKNKNNELIYFEGRIKDIENSIDNKFLNKRSLDRVDAEISSAQEEMKKHKDNLKCIDLTIEILKASFEEIQKSFGPKLNYAAGKVLKEITSGKYSELRISQDYDIKITDEAQDVVRDIDYFSNGTCDQIYFSLRMAIIKTIFESGKRVPLILDDAFVQYDEERLAKVLEFLYEYSKENQVIIFTCQRREMDILKNYSDINYLKI